MIGTMDFLCMDHSLSEDVNYRKSCYDVRGIAST